MSKRRQQGRVKFTLAGTVIDPVLDAHSMLVIEEIARKRHLRRTQVVRALVVIAINTLEDDDGNLRLDNN